MPDVSPARENTAQKAAAQYTPGDALLAVGPGGVAFVDGRADAVDLAAVWASLADDSDLSAVIQALADTCRGELASIPPFLIALVDPAGVRVAVRGDITASVINDAGSQRSLSGAGVSTWMEQVLPDVRALQASVAASEPGAVALPLRDGIVGASACVLRWGEASHTPAAPVPARRHENYRVDMQGTPRDSVHTDLPGDLGDTVTSARRTSPSPRTPSNTVRDQSMPDRSAHDESAPGGATQQQPAPPEQPPMRLRLSTGQTVRVDRAVVIGRRPRSARITGDAMPHLVAVSSPRKDISRSHLEIRTGGGGIVVTDLNTTNGTLLRRGGTRVMRLHPGRRTAAAAGDILDIGDGVTVLVEQDGTVDAAQEPATRKSSLQEPAAHV